MVGIHGISVLTTQMATALSHEGKMAIDHLLEVKDEAVEDALTLAEAMMAMEMAMAMAMVEALGTISFRQQNCYQCLNNQCQFKFSSETQINIILTKLAKTQNGGGR
jgi:hypothetical protein